MTTIKELAALRKEIEEVKAVMKSELENFQASPFFVDLQTRRAGIEEAIRIAEDKVRADAQEAAKEGTVPAELATVTDEPRAQIDTDLSAFLPQE